VVGRRRYTVAAAVLGVLSAGAVALAVAAGDGDPATDAAAPTTMPEPTTAESGPAPPAIDAQARATATTATTVPVTPVPPAVAATLAPVLAGAPAAAAAEPTGLAQQIVEAEHAIADPASSPALVAAAGRVQQLAYRRLGDNPAWEAQVLSRIPSGLHGTVGRHVAARREFRAMHTRLGATLPAWRIVEPPPADQLLAFYHEAEARFGVPWTVLAAVNLVETGLGRIVGLSTAGAQGPMQFMPPTWSAYGMGGDVWNARDAVLGAANYLAANGAGRGPEGVSAALERYNHNEHYVLGVQHYAEILRADPRAFLAMHAWQVVFTTVEGDIVLPVGYEEPAPVPWRTGWPATDSGTTRTSPPPREVAGHGAILAQ
jgi:membrane-bound lytic murein transglycosylase B